jgi:hypothetical protein
MRRGDTSRHEAGLKVFGELGVPPEHAQIELRQRRISLWDDKQDGAAAVSRQELRPSRG